MSQISLWCAGPQRTLGSAAVDVDVAGCAVAGLAFGLARGWCVVICCGCFWVDEEQV